MFYNFEVAKNFLIQKMEIHEEIDCFDPIKWESSDHTKTL